MPWWIVFFIVTTVAMGFLAGVGSNTIDSTPGWVVGFLIGVLGHPVLVFILFSELFSENPYQKGGSLGWVGLFLEIATGVVTYFATVVYLKLRDM